MNIIGILWSEPGNKDSSGVVLYGSVADGVVIIERELYDGVPCDHAGCLSHLSHPCEGCGRIGGKAASVARRGWKTIPVFDGLSKPVVSYTLEDYLKQCKKIAIEIDRPENARKGVALLSLAGLESMLKLGLGGETNQSEESGHEGFDMLADGAS